MVAIRWLRLGVECRPATVHAGSFAVRRRAGSAGRIGARIHPRALVGADRVAGISTDGRRPCDARAIFLQQLAEGSLLATARYDHGPLDALASANSAVRLQVGTTGSTRGLQFGAGVDSWRSNINGNGVVVPATTISGWIRRFGLSFSAELSARSLPGRSRVSGDTARFTFVPDSFGRRSMTAGADTAITGNPYVPSPAPPTSAQPTTRRTEALAFGEAALRVSGMLMSFGIDGHAGLGFAAGGQARGFGSLILTKWISPGLAFTGGVVLQPPEPGSSARRAGGLLGIRLASGPRLFPHFVNAPKVGASSCSVRLIDGNVTIELRAPSASHVELSGDFTRWRPMTFEHVGGDRWTLTTRLVPGVHRFRRARRRRNVASSSGTASGGRCVRRNCERDRRSLSRCEKPPRNCTEGPHGVAQKHFVMPTLSSRAKPGIWAVGNCNRLARGSCNAQWPRSLASLGMTVKVRMTSV